MRSFFNRCGKEVLQLTLALICAAAVAAAGLGLLCAFRPKALLTCAGLLLLGAAGYLLGSFIRVVLILLPKKSNKTRSVRTTLSRRSVTLQRYELGGNVRGTLFP